MSLLFQNISDNIIALSRKIYEKHFELDPRLEDEYDNTQKRLMYNDILFNLGYLDTAVRLQDEKIFTEYSVWLYRLLCSLMKDLSKERVRDQVTDHFSVMGSVIKDNSTFADKDLALRLIGLGKAAIVRECEEFTETERYSPSDYMDIKKEYLESLMNNDTRKAMEIISNAIKSGIKLEDIYTKILESAMHDVGDLWHKNIISVDKEHYITSATQTALSQFYPIIYSNTRKNGYLLLSCAVGSELHEMGIRMISDLFEYHGWDTVYLGAALPKEYILNSIEENRPDLIALSVTMPPHLILCKEIIDSIRELFPNVLIAVGGRAFKTTDKMWEKWNADVYAEDAVQMLEWAERYVAARSEGSPV
ncbi:MAG: B12-binding domain-containing protein [Synergistaceae bacterium]